MPCDMSQPRDVAALEAYARDALGTVSLWRAPAAPQHCGALQGLCATAPRLLWEHSARVCQSAGSMALCLTSGAQPTPCFTPLSARRLVIRDGVVRRLQVSYTAINRCGNPGGVITQWN